MNPENKQTDTLDTYIKELIEKHRRLQNKFLNHENYKDHAIAEVEGIIEALEVYGSSCEPEINFYKQALKRLKPIAALSNRK